MNKSILNVLGICTLSMAAYLIMPASPVLASEMSPIVIKNYKTVDASKFSKPPANLINVVSSSDLNVISEQRSIISNSNSFFSNKIKSGKATDQKKSGRCWMFATLNAMRPAIFKKYNLEDFELSENYLFFWDKLEKANYFLELIISSADRDLSDKELKFFMKDPVPDGGHWNYCTALIEKYGVVPKSEMNETANSEDSTKMNKVLYSLMRKDAQILRDMIKNGAGEAEVLAKKEAMLADVYSILCACLGEPPKKISLRYEDKNKKVSNAKIMTPQEFFKELEFNFDDYVCLLNVPCWKYNEVYEVMNMKNMVEAKGLLMLNVNIDDMKSVASKSIVSGDTVWFSADAGKDMNRTTGLMANNLWDYSSIFNIDIKQDKGNKILYGNLHATHAMLITGVDLSPDKKTVKWQVQNSWGKTRGEDGYFNMYDDWFSENIFQIIVHKKYLTSDMIKNFKGTVNEIPEFDALKGI